MTSKAALRPPEKCRSTMASLETFERFAELDQDV